MSYVYNFPAPGYTAAYYAPLGVAHPLEHTYAYHCGYDQGLDHEYVAGILPFGSTEEGWNRWPGEGEKKRGPVTVQVGWPSYENTMALARHHPGRETAESWADAVFPNTARYTEANPVLASDTTKVLYDVRVAPHIGIEPRMHARFAGAPATSRKAAHVRLISYDFPWALDIDVRGTAAAAGAGATALGNVYTSGYVCGYVTVGDVWATLFHALSEPITDAEWTLLARGGGGGASERNRARRERIAGALAGRRAAEGVPEYARRVDWLGRNVLFHGLHRDDGYAQEVLPPGRPVCADTYVVRLEKARRGPAN